MKQLVRKNSYNEIMKKVFIFFFLLFFLLKTDFIYAQNPDPSISPTPEPGSLGGRCGMENININQINVPRITVDLGNPYKWGCISLPIIGDLFCFSDILESARNTVADMLDFRTLQEQFRDLNICDAGLEPDDVTSPNCTCIDPNTRDLTRLSDLLCARHLRNNTDRERLSCSSCFLNGGYYSALGCIYFSNWQTFFERNVFGLSVSLAGLVALLCIIYAAIQMQLSQGNAEKIKKAQELLTSCIMGLMLILFSVFILRVIGVDILRIPGFR
jgi:hypothetical protein